MTLENYKQKAHFVKALLQPLTIAANENIKKLDYELQDNNEEFVIITYTNNYTRKICVTCDSLRAIAFDVIEQMH